MNSLQRACLQEALDGADELQVLPPDLGPGRRGALESGLGAFLVVVLGTQAGRGLGRLGKLGDALLTEGTTSSRGRRECPLGALLC